MQLTTDDTIPAAGELAERLSAVRERLDRHETFSFPTSREGLFPAAHFKSSDRDYMNYQFVWVRDNVHIAHCLHLIGESVAAVRNITALASYFHFHRQRFLDVIDGHSDPRGAMKRPHVRFNGNDLTEVVAQDWNHAQNDALGYFLWLFCKLVAAGSLSPAAEYLETVALFPRYFSRVEYWQDEDSGHWEELPKIEASSIGVVVSALRQLRKLQEMRRFSTILEQRGAPMELTDELIAKGEEALLRTLPWECVQEDPHKQRRYDSALLFLIFPTAAVDDVMALRILDDVHGHLEREIGIIRYPGDTFWCRDYKQRLDDSERTDKLDVKNKRARIRVRSGEEAQWCLFDPVVSIVYGRFFLREKDEWYLGRQLRHLNRSLRQLTAPDSPFGAYKCPEAYYLEDGEWVLNEATPLLWTQANLRLALWQMEQTLAVL